MVDIQFPVSFQYYMENTCRLKYIQASGICKSNDNSCLDEKTYAKFGISLVSLANFQSDKTWETNKKMDLGSIVQALHTIGSFFADILFSIITNIVICICFFANGISNFPQFECSISHFVNTQQISCLQIQSLPLPNDSLRCLNSCVQGTIHAGLNTRRTNTTVERS